MAEKQPDVLQNQEKQQKIPTPEVNIETYGKQQKERIAQIRSDEIKENWKETALAVLETMKSGDRRISYKDLMDKSFLKKFKNIFKSGNISQEDADILTQYIENEIHGLKIGDEVSFEDTFSKNFDTQKMSDSWSENGTFTKNNIAQNIGVILSQKGKVQDIVIDALGNVKIYIAKGDLTTLKHGVMELQSPSGPTGQTQDYYYDHTIPYSVYLRPEGVQKQTIETK